MSKKTRFKDVSRKIPDRVDSVGSTGGVTFSPDIERFISKKSVYLSTSPSDCQGTQSGVPSFRSVMCG